MVNNAAERKVSDEYTPKCVIQEGNTEGALVFKFGQESDNAESFASMVWAFPLALLLM